MYILTAGKGRVELDPVSGAFPVELMARTALRAPSLGIFAEKSPITRASQAFFGLGRARGVTRLDAPETGPTPTVLRERSTGLVRAVYQEVVLRFKPGTSERVRRAILERHGLEVKRQNPFFPDQVVLADQRRKRLGADLVDAANDFATLDEVLFATPNFVSEYRRQAAPSIPAAQWHLRNLGTVSGQTAGEDVRAADAWQITTGKRSIVVAVLDDGVDVDHPNLKSRIWKNPDRTARDQRGRDFFVPDDHPDHYDPRPKRFTYPYDQISGNDSHGTPCAGVIAAAGRDARGIAFGCRILPVKIFHADDLASDERVANAIRYAATQADIVSCSWSGGTSPDIEFAIEDAGRLGRDGRGAAVFCAVGNEYGGAVGFPASHSETVAVGASTDGGGLAPYSNVGSRVDVVAPSSGGAQGFYTTDVSYAGRGLNVGRAELGGADGAHTNDFGGTSSATPLAAGIAALMLSVNPQLSRADIRSILRESATKIGDGYDDAGHSLKFGYGRVNAGAAVEAARSLR